MKVYDDRMKWDWSGRQCVAAPLVIDGVPVAVMDGTPVTDYGELEVDWDRYLRSDAVALTVGVKVNPDWWEPLKAAMEAEETAAEEAYQQERAQKLKEHEEALADVSHPKHWQARDTERLLKAARVSPRAATKPKPFRAGGWRYKGHCAHCGTPFVAAHAGTTVCSERCAKERKAEQARDGRKSRAKAAQHKACEACGAPMAGKRSHAVTCSPACRQALKRRRDKAA